MTVVRRTSTARLSTIDVAASAERLGYAPPTEPIPENAEVLAGPDRDVDDDDEDDEQTAEATEAAGAVA